MDLIRQANELNSLKNNKFFMAAIEELREDLVNQEDSLLFQVGDFSEQELLLKMKRYAMMRVLISEVVEKLDGIILRASNEEAQDNPEL